MVVPPLLVVPPIKEDNFVKFGRRNTIFLYVLRENSIHRQLFCRSLGKQMSDSWIYTLVGDRRKTNSLRHFPPPNTLFQFFFRCPNHGSNLSPWIFKGSFSPATPFHEVRSPWGQEVGPLLAPECAFLLNYAYSLPDWNCFSKCLGPTSSAHVDPCSEHGLRVAFSPVAAPWDLKCGCWRTGWSVHCTNEQDEAGVGREGNWLQWGLRFTCFPWALQMLEFFSSVQPSTFQSHSCLRIVPVLLSIFIIIPFGLLAVKLSAECAQWLGKCCCSFPIPPPHSSWAWLPVLAVSHLSLKGWWCWGVICLQL